jgi:hypothetical protein
MLRKIQHTLIALAVILLLLASLETPVYCQAVVNGVKLALKNQQKLKMYLGESRFRQTCLMTKLMRQSSTI